MSPRSWRIRAQDILNAISEIEVFISEHKTQESFLIDTKAVRAVTGCLIVIGEAANHLPQGLKEKYSVIRWDQIRGMRNRLTHEYFSVDDSVIWKTAKTRLPIFKVQIQKMLDQDKEQ